MIICSSDAHVLSDGMIYSGTWGGLFPAAEQLAEADPAGWASFGACRARRLAVE